jgi:hypothetical protein
MPLSANPDPLGQFITDVLGYRYNESGEFVGPDSPRTQSSQATASGSGLTNTGGSTAPNTNTGMGGLGKVASKASTIAGFIEDPKSLGQAAINKVTKSVPSIGKLAGLAAGITNLVGSVRSGKIPPGAESFFSRESASPYITAKTGLDDDWRVRIDCNFELFNTAFDRLKATSGFVWPYLPNITLVSKANYTQIDPVHNIQPFQAYKNSQVEDIQISGDFSVETEVDAEYWIQGTTFLRTATKMFFGRGANLGTPPVICNLTGYGARVFNSVPVVIKAFSIDFKEDVNYIKYQGSEQTATWVPTLSTISVTVAPIYDRTRLRKFSLQDYANGKAVGYI